MRRLGSAVLAVSLFTGCGGVDSAPSSSDSPASPSLQRQQAPLTTTNVDVAPECQGIINFVNTASFEVLDLYLPSNVATNLVTRRTTSPFVTLADVASVPLVGPSRLEQIEGGARAQSYIGASCVGIIDGLAISADDDAAIVSLVNTISDSELHDVLPDAWNGAVNLLNLRPFTSTQAIADVTGIADKSLRNIRNAATLSRPFEALVTAVNATQTGVYMQRHFDWWRAMNGGYGRQTQPVCFGLEESSVPDDAIVRENLADADEVRDAVAGTVAIAKYYGYISPSVEAAGMANLDALIEGRLFKGCIDFGFEPDPWSNHHISFFVDRDTGFSVLVGSYWSE